MDIFLKQRTWTYLQICGFTYTYERMNRNDAFYSDKYVMKGDNNIHTDDIG